MSDTKKASSAHPSPKRRKRKRPKKKWEEYVHYIIQVTDWDCYYSFQISNPKDRFATGPYGQLTTLTFSGKLTEPDNTKYSFASLTLSAREDLLEERWNETPNFIGSLSAHKDTLNAYVFVPVEHMAMLMSLASTERVLVASIVGTRLRYRSGSVNSISLDTVPEDEENEN